MNHLININIIIYCIYTNNVIPFFSSYPDWNYILKTIDKGKCQTAYKQWVPNANFENGANWNAGRPPCGNDRVVIHEESAAVYVQTDTTIRELVYTVNIVTVNNTHSLKCDNVNFVTELCCCNHLSLSNNSVKFAKNTNDEFNYF